MEKDGDQVEVIRSWPIGEMLMCCYMMLEDLQTFVDGSEPDFERKHAVRISKGLWFQLLCIYTYVFQMMRSEKKHREEQSDVWPSISDITLLSGRNIIRRTTIKCRERGKKKESALDYSKDKECFAAFNFNRKAELGILSFSSWRIGWRLTACVLCLIFGEYPHLETHFRF